MAGADAVDSGGGVDALLAGFGTTDPGAVATGTALWTGAATWFGGGSGGGPEGVHATKTNVMNPQVIRRIMRGRPLARRRL